MVRKQGQARGQYVKQSGSWGGSIEAEAFARCTNRKVAIHHDDGSIDIYGSRSAKEVIHLYYSAKQHHYFPANARGRILSRNQGTPGDCFFEAATYHTGEDAAHVRQKVGQFIEESPHKLKNTRLDELECGGEYLGGARRDSPPRFRLTDQDRKKALESFSGHLELYKKAKQALQELESLTIKQIRQMEVDTAQRGGSAQKRSNCIHALSGDLKGLLSVDVYYHNDTISRGPVRMLFDISKRRYYTTLFDHDYKAVVWPPKT